MTHPATFTSSTTRTCTSAPLELPILRGTSWIFCHLKTFRFKKFWECYALLYFLNHSSFSLPYLDFAFFSELIVIPGSWTPRGGPRIAILCCCHFRPIWPRSHFFVSFLSFLMTWRNHGPALSLSIGTNTSVTRAVRHCQLHLPPSLAIQPVPISFLSVGIPPSVHLCCSCLPVQPHGHLLILSIDTIPPPAPKP